MEMDLFNERTAALERASSNQFVSRNSSIPESSQNIWKNLSKETIAEKVGALGLTIGIIIGRWLLPRGAITREQLSALLIGYVGIAADILEVFELFEEEKLMYRKTITLATLFVFSWCLLSFCLITTATKQSNKERERSPKNYKVHPVQRNQLSREDTKLKDEYINKLKEKWRKDVEGVANGKGEKLKSIWDVKEQLGIKAVKEVFAEAEKRRFDLHGDIYGILTGIFMMDGPFLVFRLYCTVQFAVDSEMHIFYTCKNAISLALLVYRLCILTCKGSDSEDDIFNETDEDKLRNVQLAIVGTTYTNMRRNQRK